MRSTLDNFAFHQAIPGYFEDLGDKLWLKLAIFGEQPLGIYARIEPDNEEYLVPMQLTYVKSGWSFYEATVDKSGHVDQTLYLFKMVWKEDSKWLAATGIEQHIPRNIQMFRYAHDRRFPDWSTSQVFYQIFPERFANGDPSLTPVEGEYKYLGRRDIVIKQWGDAPDSKTGGFEFYGGDLPGIESKLDYLYDRLGITAIYLNPVFSSQSNHKYDTVDYYKVDAHFGGNEALVSLIDKMKTKNMRLVLDAVINHTSLAHPWIDSALSGNEEDRSRFIFNENGDIETWKGSGSLPVLDFSNERNVTDFITGSDSVIRHWLQPPYSIDGWRMDVVHMLGEGNGARNNAHFLKLLRETIKQENKDAMLLGEHFFEASDWLQGDQEDCAMNYFGFAHPVRAFLANLDIAGDPIKISAVELSKWMRDARARISFSHQLIQFNQLDSHDTARFITMLNGNKKRMKMAIALLMSYIGTPCLYYATEIGLEGQSDPDCRRTFPWDEQDWDKDLFAFTQQWIKLRKELPVLQKGAMLDLYAGEHCFMFARILDEQVVIVAVNRGAQVNIEFPLSVPVEGHWQRLVAEHDLLENQGQASVQVPSESVQAWMINLK